MNTVNTIVFCKEDYKTEQEWKDAVRDATFLLLNAQYQMVIRYDEPGLGIIRIDFESSDESLGSPWPYWLTPTQSEFLMYNNPDESVEDQDIDDDYGDEPDESVAFVPGIANNLQEYTTPCVCARDKDPETTEVDKSTEKIFNDFWKSLVCQETPNANFLNEAAVKNELADYHFIIEQLPQVYSAVTGGTLSKHMYKADTVISLFMEKYGDIAETARLLPDDWDLITQDCKTNEDFKKVILDYLNCAED